MHWAALCLIFNTGTIVLFIYAFPETSFAKKEIQQLSSNDEKSNLEWLQTDFLKWNRNAVTWCICFCSTNVYMQ